MRAAGALIARAAQAWLLASFACADGPPQPQRFAVLLRAQRPSGDAVAGVRVWADGRELGTTSERGTLQANLRGREGVAVELTAACPPAYRTEQPARRLVLRQVRASTTDRAGRLQLTVRCEPLERDAAIVVLASGRDSGALPIRVDGMIVGQTELDGSAHLLISATPHTPLRVELDTSARPDLRPSRPVHTFRVGEEDGILLVEQHFAGPPVRNRPPQRPARPMRAPQRPQRID
jgi:hypothetical protein